MWRFQAGYRPECLLWPHPILQTRVAGPATPPGRSLVANGSSGHKRNARPPSGSFLRLDPFLLDLAEGDLDQRHHVLVALLDALEAQNVVIGTARPARIGAADGRTG